MNAQQCHHGYTNPLVSWQPEFVNYYLLVEQTVVNGQKNEHFLQQLLKSRSCNAEVDATMQGGYMTLLCFNAFLHLKCNQARPQRWVTSESMVNVLLEYFKLADCSIRVYKVLFACSPTNQILISCS